jgi:hypothetical protein
VLSTAYAVRLARCTSPGRHQQTSGHRRTRTTRSKSYPGSRARWIAHPTGRADKSGPPCPAFPNTAITVAFEAFRKAKRVDGAWKASAKRDAETTIRLFTEFFGDLSLRGVTREVVREFRGHLLEICSD